MATSAISEKTMTLVHAYITQEGITSPLVGVEETQTLIKMHFLGRTEPVTIRKPKPKSNTATAKARARQTAGKRKAQT